MNINLHIDRLIVDGVDIAPGQGRVLQASVTTELTRMLSEGGFSSGLSEGNALSRTTTDVIRLNEGNNPMQIGQQIAQLVYGGISHE